jgi:hypothetical protein
MNTDNWVWGIILLAHHPWNACLETYGHFSCPTDITWTTWAKCRLNHLVLILDLHLLIQLHNGHIEMEN